MVAESSATVKAANASWLLGHVVVAAMVDTAVDVATLVLRLRAALKPVFV